MSDEVLIGSHIGMSGPNYFLDTVKKALSFGETTFMFYSGAPQNSIRTPVEKCKIVEGQEILKNSQINIDKIIVHAPYIINLANTVDINKFNFSVEILINELKRTFSFGAKVLVLHPGSYGIGDEKESLLQIAKGLDIALEQDKTDVTIALETMSGRGHELGKNFDELAFIINNSTHKERLGVCLDTCHINDSGYEVSKEEEIIEQFDQIIGLRRLKVIHMNDSKNEIGSHKDRHENIGFGKIGFDALIKYVFDPKLKNIPKILETPYIGEFSPYKDEILMIKSKEFDRLLKEKIINSHLH